jgi:predicted transcriptional regulator
MTIPTDLSVESGKVVLLPGIKREVVAIVDGLISVPTDPVKRVLLRSPINIQSQRWVEVKKN